MWSNDRPTTPGFYWCHQRGKTRIVHIWCYKNGTELFTNEDGGASIKDTLYDGTQWMAAVIPTNPQDQNQSAQPAPSVPEGWLQRAARMAALARKLREPDWHFESIREMQRELCALEDAALAAASEAAQ